MEVRFLLPDIDSYNPVTIEDILQNKDNLSRLFIEVIRGLASGDDLFPIFYLLSMIDLNDYNEEEQNKLATLLVYLRLEWIQNPELKNKISL